MPRSTKTKTISLEAAVKRKGIKAAERRGFKNSFSAYISKLILDDHAAIRAEERMNGKAVPA